MRRSHPALVRRVPQDPQATTPQADRRVLTAVEFDVLWEWLGLGPTPVVLRLASPGRTGHERAQMVAAGWAALRDRGLATPTGPDPQLLGLLHLLARPTRLVEIRICLDGATRGRNVRAAVAGRREGAVVAVRQDETITITPAAELPPAAAAVFPALPAGPGRSITVRNGDLGTAGSGPAEPAVALVDRGVPAADVAAAALMLRDAAHRGQIAALAADGWGVLRRLPRSISVLDAPRGRYLLTRSVSTDGTPWTTVGPGDDRRLHQRIGELLTEAAQLT